MHTDIDSMARLFQASSNPLRLQVLVALSEQTRTPTQLADHIGVARVTLQRHLRVLRDQGLVRPDPRGYYRVIDPEALDRLRRAAPEIFPALPPVGGRGEK